MVASTKIYCILQDNWHDNANANIISDTQWEIEKEIGVFGWVKRAPGMPVKTQGRPGWDREVLKVKGGEHFELGNIENDLYLFEPKSAHFYWLPCHKHFRGQSYLYRAWWHFNSFLLISKMTYEGRPQGFHKSFRLQLVFPFNTGHEKLSKLKRPPCRSVDCPTCR